MPLVCRPFSLNSYCLSKAWFRTHSVDLRAGDITAYTSACKGWLYQDMLEKPNELLLYRPVEEGGLGLHHVQSKAQASLISTFLQTAVNPRFQSSLYHSLLYRRYCLHDTTVPELAPPPYYSMEFFETIKDVVDNSPLNPVQMTVKQWYRYLLEVNVTMEKVDDEGRMAVKKCKVEELNPSLNWQLSYYLGRLTGLTPEVKTFNFKMTHMILPCKERISQLLPNALPACNLCRAQETESITHAMFQCEINREAALYLLAHTKIYDTTITQEKVLKLQIHTDALYELPTMVVLCSGLSLIWRNRQDKKATRLYDIRAEIECRIQTLRKSRKRKLREASKIIQNSLENFPVV